MPADRLELDLAALAALGISPAAISIRERLDGDDALRFLAALPELAARWQRTLGVRGARSLPGGVLSAALLCEPVAGGAPVVLKLSDPRAASARAEAAALAAWGGRGACRLLWSGDEGRVLVLEAIRPGTAVSPGPERSDAAAAAALLSALHLDPAAAPAEIPPAAVELGWRFRRAHGLLDSGTFAGGMVDHAAIEAAHASALELDRGTPARRLLHGDFIDKNLLVEAGGRWRAIDPRPCIGDPCLDAAFWALAHRPGEGVRERCELVAAAAGLCAGRVWSWALAFAVSEAVLVTDRLRAQAHASVAGLVD